jgi:hypothetical protein
VLRLTTEGFEQMPRLESGRHCEVKFLLLGVLVCVPPVTWGPVRQAVSVPLLPRSLNGEDFSHSWDLA